MQTVMNVADNSGVKAVRCIKVLGGSHHMIAGIGDVVIASAISVAPTSKIKKGQVIRVLIVRTKSPILRPDGSKIRFDDNAVVLVNKDNDPIGTRFFGPAAREVRKKSLRITSLAPEVL